MANTLTYFQDCFGFYFKAAIKLVLRVIFFSTRYKNAQFRPFVSLQHTTDLLFFLRFCLILEPLLLFNLENELKKDIVYSLQFFSSVSAVVHVNTGMLYWAALKLATMEFSLLVSNLYNKVLKSGNARNAGKYYSTSCLPK